MKILLTSIFILVQLISLSPVYGINVKDKNEYLLDVRDDDGDIYLNRFSIYKNLKPFDIELSGFGESQWNFETANWEKITAGIELDKCLYKFIHVGGSVQFISGEMQDYMAFKPDDKSIETTTKVNFIFPIFGRLFNKKLSLRFFEEYSYNLEKGAAGLNEIGIETSYDLNKNFHIGFGWRHSDRIHNFDTDYATSFFSLHF